jgi:hypothetical protein
MREALPRKAEARTQRRREAGADVVLAIGQGRRVDGQDERPEARGLNAVDERVDTGAGQTLGWR